MPWRRSCLRGPASHGANSRSTRLDAAGSAGRSAAPAALRLDCRTNGKGSTAATLASILTASGVRTGLYTSPHLARANERIRLDGVEIEDDAFASLYFRVHDTAQQLVLNGKLRSFPAFLRF